MRRLFLGLLLCMPLAAQVAFLNTNNWAKADASSLSSAFTVNSGANLAAIAYIEALNASSSSFVSSITLGGSTMTDTGCKVHNSGGHGDSIDIFYLLNPPVGSNTLAVSLASGNVLAANVTVFSGVNQTTPVTAGSCQTNAKTNASPTITIPSSTSDLTTTAIAYYYGNFGTLPPATNQTRDGNYAIDSSGSTFVFIGDHATTAAASITDTWFSPSTGYFSMAGLDLAAAPILPSLSFSGCPTTGQYGLASSACTVAITNGTFDGAHTVTITDSLPAAVAGTFTPSVGSSGVGSITVTPTNGASSFTVTYSPPVVGKRLWTMTTSNILWTAPVSPIAYTAMTAQPCNFTLTGSGTQSIAATSGWTSTGGCGHSTPATGDSLAVTASGGTITLTVPNDGVVHALGTCPANNTTYDLTLTAASAGSAVLDVQPGATLLYCGNIKATSVVTTAGSVPTVWADLKLETGATLYLDQAQASFAHRTVTNASGEWSRLLFGSSTDICTYGPGAAYSCPTNVQTINVGTVTPVLYDPNGTTDSHLFKIYGTAVKGGCGSATAGCITYSTGGNSSWSSYSEAGAIYLNGDVFDGTGTLQTLQRLNYVPRLSIVGSHFVNDLIGVMGTDGGTGVSTPQSCTISGSYFSGSVGVANMTPVGCSLKNNVLENGMQWTGVTGAFSGNVYGLHDGTTGVGADRYVSVPVLNNYWVNFNNAPSNHHYNTPNINTYLQGNLFEAPISGSGEGHCNWTNTSGASDTVIELDNISVKAADGNNTCQIFGWDPATQGPTGMPRAWLDHNGAYGTGTYSWFVMLGHGNFPGDQVLKSLRYNLGWSSVSGSQNLAIGQEGQASANAYSTNVNVPGEHNNNWYLAAQGQSYGAGVNTNCNPSTSYNTPYDQCTNSGTPGTGDTTLDPKLLDPSRGVLKWASVMQGQPATLAGFTSALKGCSNLAYCIQQLEWYVRQGYQPTNLGLKGTAQDGGVAGVAGTLGSGYSGACAATITVQDTDDLGSGAAATCTFVGGIPRITITNPGTHYRMTTPAAVTVTGTGGSGAALNVAVSPSDIGPVPITLFAGVAP